VPKLQGFAAGVTGGSLPSCSRYVADEWPDEVALALIDFVGSR
jgi:hypothetical protein